MAGIITNVDSDISKLRSLKKEIEQVKKALKGIDIKVDVDIAKDLEAQLRSLTGQYDELSKKVAEIDGKIKISTKNINESTEKIIKVQESILKASQVEGQSSNTQTATVTNVQTAAVQAQAAAYEDLKEEIDKVLGSRAENIKRLVDEEANIKRIKREIAELAAKQDKVGLSKGETQRLRDLNNSLIESKTAVSQLNQVLRNDAKLGQSAADSMTRLGQELSRMRMAYRELTDEEKDSPFGRVLKASIEEADAKIKELDASIGNHQRNVGNYASSWNGLSFSIQQLARELPSLAYGPTVFFSAISNNLPMLTDEIKRAREEYQRTVAAGQKGTPVWKQVAKSVISWQTLLIAGITILTMHGDKIIEWVGKLFKGSDAALSAGEAMKKLNKAMEFKDLGTDLANFQRLVNLYRDLGDNAEAKKQFIEDYKDELDETGIAVNDVKDAERLLIEKTPDYIKALTLRARATAAMKLAAKEMEESVKKQAENAEKIKELESRRNDAIFEGRIKDQTVVMQSTAGSYTQVIPGAETIQKQIDKLKGTADEKAASIYIGIAEDIRKEAEALEKASGLTTTDEQAAKDKAAKDAAEALKAKQEAEKNVNNIILNQQKANQDAEIKLMAEGSAKKIAELNLEYDRLIATIIENEQKVRAAQGGALTPEQEAVFTTAKSNAKQTRDMGIAAVRAEENERIGKLLEEYQTLTDKYLETDRKFAKDRADLIKAGASQATIAELDYKRDESLTAIAEDLAEREATFKEWMDSITAMSLEELRKAIVLAEQELDLLLKANTNNKKALEAKGRLEIQKRELAKKENKSVQGPDDDAEKGWQELSQTLREVAKEFEEIGEAIGGTAGEVVSTVGTVGASVLTMVDNIATFSQMSQEGIDKTASKTVQAIQMVERASLILTIIGAALKIITKIVNLATQMHDKKHEKRIQKLQKQIDTLEKGYDKLGDAVERAFSKDASKLIEQQNKLLEQQRNLIQQQIKEEEAKKKTDKSKIEDYQNQIDEINKTLEENKEKAVDAIFGEDISSAIENFAEAYADAVAKGGDKWVSVKDTVKNMMKQMVVESIKGSLQSSQAIEKIRQKLLEFYTDNVLSLTEQEYIYKMAENVQKELDRQFGWADSLLKDQTTTEQKATYGGFEAMTSEDSKELSGRFTALQMAGEEIKREAINQTITLNEIKGSLDAYMAANGGPGVQTSLDNILTFVSQSYMELQQINQNTAENVTELKKVVRQINRWDSKIMSL